MSVYPSWTEEELALLRKYYPEKGSLIPELLKTRSQKAIKIKANRLGIYVLPIITDDLIKIVVETFNRLERKNNK